MAALSALPVGAQETLTLDDALALAEASNRTLQGAHLAVDQAADRLGLAKARRLPLLSLESQVSSLLRPVEFSLSRGQLGEYPGTGPLPGSDITIDSDPSLIGRVTGRLALPLTQQRRLGLGVKYSMAGLESEQAGLGAQRLAIRSEVRRNYRALLQAQDGLAASRSTQQFLQELERSVTQAVAVEAAMKADLLDVQANLAAEEARALMLRNAADTARERINVMVGKPIDNAWSPAPISEPSALPSLVEARARALAGRPELRRARLTAKQAELGWRIKRSESIPDISLALTYDGFHNVELLPERIMQAGVIVSWEPFSFGRRKREISERNHARRQAELAAQEAEEATAVDVDAAYRRAQEADAIVRAQQAAEAAAIERFRVTDNRYRVGASTLRDLLDAQSRLTNARTTRLDAENARAEARRDLERAMGGEL